MQENLEIIFKSSNKTVRPIAGGLPLVDIKNAVLGQDYELELIFVDSHDIKILNLEHRGIDKPTDILSFPISEKNGQIFISPKEAKEESKKFGREFDNFIAFLFIHGLMHLKGYDHGSTMESEEQKIRQKFGV